jgi:hypothetical protein
MLVACIYFSEVFWEFILDSIFSFMPVKFIRGPHRQVRGPRVAITVLVHNLGLQKAAIYINLCIT